MGEAGGSQQLVTEENPGKAIPWAVWRGGETEDPTWDVLNLYQCWRNVPRGDARKSQPLDPKPKKA